MKPKLLPVGRQDFKTIIEDNCIYVDKTEHIYRLLTSGPKYYFLSRPRRFGKSLLLNTIKSVFLGEKALFNNTYIDHTDWKFEPHPILYFSFNNISYRDIGLKKAINHTLQKIAQQYQLDIEAEANGEFFELLINTLHQKYNQKVVILIDEYDKPLLENLENAKIEIARENRDILRDFYGAIKSNDHAIQFFFMTGVSKFSQLSIFSQLNNLIDITLIDEYATLCGFTEPELKTDFGFYVERAQKVFNGTLFEQLKEKYNGFSWNGKDFVYNPFSYLQFLYSRSLTNYWSMSGSPKFLTDLLRDKNYDLTKIGKQTANTISLLSFDFENIDEVSLMFQTGYLTIKEKIGNEQYILDFPNNEVSESFSSFLMETYTDIVPSKSINMLYNMSQALRVNNFDEFMLEIKSLFAGLPYQIIKKAESYYHSIFYTLLHVLGFKIDCEVSVATGRIDAVIKTPTHIYLIEFKIDDQPENAIKQIIEKKYADKYIGDTRQIVLAGICFDTTKKDLAYKTESR